MINSKAYGIHWLLLRAEAQPGSALGVMTPSYYYNALFAEEIMQQSIAEDASYAASLNRITLANHSIIFFLDSQKVSATAGFMFRYGWAVDVDLWEPTQKGQKVEKLRRSLSIQSPGNFYAHHPLLIT